MEIFWKIDSLTVRPKQDEYINVVHSAAWRCVVTEHGLSATEQGVAVFTGPIIDFVFYEQLSEQIVLNWVWEACYNDDPIIGWSKSLIEQNLIAKIQTQQITERPLPWIPPTPPQPERATLEQRTEALELLVDYLLEGPTA